MKLHIKYMVSLRCKMMVRSALEKLGLLYTTIDLGELNLKEDITARQWASLKIALAETGLELMDDKKAILIEKIKIVIVEMVHYADETPKINFSDYLSGKLQHNYAYLATAFSEVTGTTIEHYIIAHKIEKVKELLLYDDLNLTQISHKMNYSSVAHLSSQFKKVTGLTPSYFKQLQQHRNRNAIENL